MQERNKKKIRTLKKEKLVKEKSKSYINKEISYQRKECLLK